MNLVEHDRAILVRDLPNAGLAKGDVGVVIHVHTAADGVVQGYLLELFSVDGESLQTVTVAAGDVRAAGPADRMHARHAAA